MCKEHRKRIEALALIEGHEIRWLSGVPHIVTKTGHSERFTAWFVNTDELIIKHKVHIGFVEDKITAYVNHDKQVFGDKLDAVVIDASLKGN